MYFVTRFGFADEYSQNVYDRALEEFADKHKGWDQKYSIKEVRTQTNIKDGIRNTELKR